MSRGTLIVFAALAVIFAIFTGLAVRSNILGFGPQEQTALIGGPFQLVDTKGKTVTEAALKGKWSAVFFGFTYCPDVCPTTLFAMGQAETALGKNAREVQTVFISVDPERDTPAQMAAYLDNPAFPKHILGLTGTPAQAEVAAKAYRVFHQKVGEGPGYTVNHFTGSYLMNPGGQFACIIPYGLTPAQIAAKIEGAMAKGSRSTSC